jgi:hypothetical protein
MVSQSSTDVVGRTDRGFVTRETVVASSIDSSGLEYPLPSFWGSVIAGAVVALSIGILSECLMFGCHVGVTAYGALNFGAGAAIWMIVTACVAYIIGGMVTGQLSLHGGWLRGLTMWGFSIPLLLLITAIISGGAGLAYSHFTHVTEQIANGSGATTLSNGNLYVNFASAWIGFVCLGCGLIFALIGSSLSAGCATKNMTNAAGQ